MIETVEILSKAAISDRVRELGRQISADYGERPLVLLGILNGAFIFLADLVREISLPIEIDFIRVSSYGNKTCSSGTVQLSKDTDLDLSGKDVLLVEDIVDSGKTLACLSELLAGRKAHSVRCCALIDKRERREHSVQIDYQGFILHEGFLIGYGLDYAGQHRHYPSILQIVGGI